MGDRFLSLVTNVLYNTTLSDMETCYKLFDRQVLDGITSGRTTSTSSPRSRPRFCAGAPHLRGADLLRRARPDEGKKITWSDGFAALATLVRYRFWKGDLTELGVGAVVVNYNAGEYLVECVRQPAGRRRGRHRRRRQRVERRIRPPVAASDSTVVSSRRERTSGSGRPQPRPWRRGRRVRPPPQPRHVVEPGTVKVLTDALDRDPGLALVGPRLENIDGIAVSVGPHVSVRDRRHGHAFLGPSTPNRFTRRYRMLDWDHAGRAPSTGCAGTCMMLRRSAFEAVGGFDERYFMYVEDVDLCWRLGARAAAVAYEPAGRVVHTSASRASRPPTG